MSDHNAVNGVLIILLQYKPKPKRILFMLDKTNLNDVRTKTENLYEIYFERNDNINEADFCFFGHEKQ